MKVNHVIAGTNFAIAASISGCHFFGGPYFFKNLKENFTVKENGKEVKIPNKLSLLIDNVMKEMKLTKEHKDLIKTFFTTGLNPIHFGHVTLKKDVWLGFPQNFIVDERIHINLTTMIDDFKVPTESPESQQLKSSLVLSEKAKKFAIAQNIYEVTNLPFLPRVTLPFVSCVITNILVVTILSSSKKKIKKWLLIHMNNVVLAILIYLLSYDCVSICIQTKADSQAAQLGKSYIEGGIEYYEKILERNKAIKKLNKKSNITDEGEISLFSPITRIKYKTRLEFLKKFEESKDSPSLFRYIISAII